MDSHQGLTGLANLGNSCYMNSALQCLSNTKLLRNYMLGDNVLEELNTNKQALITKDWKNLLTEIWNENCTISPNTLHKALRMYFLSENIENFTDFRQNDSHEFITLFIDIMHMSLAKEVNITISGNVVNDLDKMALAAMKSWRQYFKNSYSEIVNIFYGQFVSTIKSLDNEVISAVYDPFPSLSVEIPDNSENINLYSCLDHFSSDEILDGENKYKCDKTNTYKSAKKKIQIWTCPKILIIHLKRFSNNFTKNNKVINFPIDNLNLSKYSIGYDKYKSNYRLIGVVNHIGSYLGGHYYSYCRNKENWFEYNDEKVVQINKLNVVNQNAYCLFYEKIE